MHRYRLKLLTIEMFSEIAEHMCGAGSQSTDKRHDPRAGVLAEVDLVAISSAGTWAGRARVRDISRSGLSLLINVELVRDQMILVRLPSRIRGRSVELTCTVAYCRAEPSGHMFQLGTRIQSATQIRSVSRDSGAKTDAFAWFQREEQTRIATAILR